MKNSACQQPNIKHITEAQSKFSARTQVIGLVYKVELGQSCILLNIISFQGNQNTF